MQQKDNQLASFDGNKNYDFNKFIIKVHRDIISRNRSKPSPDASSGIKIDYAEIRETLTLLHEF